MLCGRICSLITKPNVSWFRNIVVDDFKPTFNLKINKIAGYLFIPYLWVSFAAVLNGSIWWLNS
jgi:hypothetical protein